MLKHSLGPSQVAQQVKESAYNAGDLGSIRGLGRSWRREWLSAPVFLPREYNEQRSLVG